METNTATTDQTDEAVPAVQAPGTHHSQFEIFRGELRQNTFSLVESAITLTMLLTALFAPSLALHNPTTQFEAPDGEHSPIPTGTEMLIESSADGVVGTTTAYLDTDHHDQDIPSRIIYGLRTLMTVSFSAIGLAVALGVIADTIAGYHHNTQVDEVVMRFMDILFSFPSLILTIAVVGVLGVGSTEYDSFAPPNTVKAVAVIGVIYIPSFAHVVHGSVLKEVEEDYIGTVKFLGTGDRHILLRDIAVNTLPTVVVQETLYTRMVVPTSAALSFLGLSIQPPNASLGLMLSDARGCLHSGEWWYSVFPGLVIVIIIFGFSLLGDSLRNTFDPRNDGGE